MTWKKTWSLIAAEIRFIVWAPTGSFTLVATALRCYMSVTLFAPVSPPSCARKFCATISKICSLQLNTRDWYVKYFSLLIEKQKLNYRPTFDLYFWSSFSHIKAFLCPLDASWQIFFCVFCALWKLSDEVKLHGLWSHVCVFFCFFFLSFFVS